MTKVVTGLGDEPSRYIVQNMRAIDRKEIFATREDDDEERLVFDMMWLLTRPGLSFTFFADDGEPVSVMGFQKLRNGVAAVWAFGTDRWDEVVLSMTKIGRRAIVRTFLDEGYHRAECAALKERADTAKWLPLFGFRPEADLAGFGHQREDFLLYVWRPENVLRRW